VEGTRPAFVTKRANNSKPYGYTSHILPHLLSVDNVSDYGDTFNRNAGGGSPTNNNIQYQQYNNNNNNKSFGSNKFINTMDRHQPSTYDRKAHQHQFQDRNGLTSARSTSSVRSGRSDRSARSIQSRGSNRSSGSVNMMLLDEENQKRISELEKTLEEEKKGREEVVKELQSLKHLMESHFHK
jgi:hypothetical protein